MAQTDRRDGTSSPRVLSADADALLSAVTTLTEPEDPGDVRAILRHAVEAACAVTGAVGGVVAVTGLSGRVVDLVRSVGLSPEDGRLLAQRSGDADLMVPVTIRGEEFGRVCLRSPLDRTFGEADERLVRALSVTTGVLVDNARARVQSERRRAFLEHAAHINESLQPPFRVEEALAQVALSASRVADASAVAVVQVRREGDLEVSAVAGRGARDVPWLIEQIDPAVVTATEEADVAFLRHGDNRLVVLVPLNSHLSSNGVLLCVLDGPGAALGQEEAELLGTFADQASLALDRAQSISDRQELMLVSDRDRIARDLHDVVIQRLFATGLHLQRTSKSALSDEVKERLAGAVRDLDLTIADIRTTIFDLQRPSVQAVRDEVRAVVKEYIALLGFTPLVRTSGPVDSAVSPLLSEQLLAVLREALSNVMRHADADATVIELEATPTHLTLRVTDNGRGLPPGRTESGLRNARRRAVEHGGSLELAPATPRGTVLEWTAALEEGPGQL